MASEIIASRALTTLERMKTRLTITGIDFDTLLERLVMSVTDQIESLCNRKFGEATYTNELYTVYGSEQDMIALNNIPVTALSSLQYRAGTPSAPSWTSFIADQYEIVRDGKNGLVRVYGGLSRGENNIRATYVAGYKIDFTNVTDPTKHNLPFDITDLAERLITKKFKKRDAEGKSQESFERNSVTWESLLTQEDKDIIARYGRTPSFV